MSTDWMPGRRQDQLAMAKNWASLFAVKGTAWEIDSGEILILNGKITKADEALTISQSSERTDSTSALVNMRFKDLVAYMRFIHQRKFYQPLLTDADYIDLGLKIPDTIMTTIPAPVDVARGSIVLTIRYVLTVVHEIIVGPHSDVRANHGVRVNFGVVADDPAAQSALTGKQYYLSAPPHSPDQLAADEFTRRKRHAIAFPAEDSGKVAWFALRVENSKGDKGPWGEMFSGIIP